MMQHMKQVGLFAILLSLILLVTVSGGVAGDLEPPAGPDDPGSAMLTLGNAYNRLAEGTAGEKRTGGFTEPSSSPESTGHTIDEIMATMPAPDDTDGASPSDVAEGKSYWGLRTDGTWGLQNGTSKTCAVCIGTLSPGGRWCDQENGTVKDMTTGLVWLQDAGWGGLIQFYYFDEDTDTAHDRTARFGNGTPSFLSDGSQSGDWRLPTKSELIMLASGPESVRVATPRLFTNLQCFRSGGGATAPSTSWWTSTSTSGNNEAWIVSLSDGNTYSTEKDAGCCVWPVRSDN